MQIMNRLFTYKTAFFKKNKHAYCMHSSLQYKYSYALGNFYHLRFMRKLFCFRGFLE